MKKLKKQQTMITTCVIIFCAMIICGCVADYYYDDIVYIPRHRVVVDHYIPREEVIVYDHRPRPPAPVYHYTTPNRPAPQYSDKVYHVVP